MYPNMPQGMQMGYGMGYGGHPAPPPAGVGYKLFVGMIPYSTGEAELTSVFSQFGPLMEVCWPLRLQRAPPSPPLSRHPFMYHSGIFSSL